MKKISAAILITFLCSSLSAKAGVWPKIPDRTTVGSAQLSSYRVATDLQHSQYLRQVERRLKRLREATPYYANGSFYGALPADTRWAKRRIADRQIMQETIAENQYPQELPASQVAVTERNPQRANPTLPQLTRYIAQNDQSAGELRPVDTPQGVRIPATTLLTAEGLQLQATVGCGGCHQQ